MGGTRAVWEEPGKQKPRSCRAQELARSSAQENEWRKKAEVPRSVKSSAGNGERQQRATAERETGGLAHTSPSKRALDSGLYSRV